MMKKLAFTLFAFIIFSAANAQISDPVKWIFTSKKVAPNTYELHMTAVLDAKWHIYAQDAGGDDAPATTLSFSKNPLVTLDGKTKEVGKLEKSFDQNFNSELKFYENTVDFVQKVKVKSNVPTVVKGKITFMVCNDRKCLPPKDVPFSIKVSSK